MTALISHGLSRLKIISLAVKFVNFAEKKWKTMLITSNALCSSSGSIFSKDSTFIHLLENALNSSRAFVQKPAIVLVIPAVHILCVAMALCVNLIRKLTGGVSFEVNKISYRSLITICFIVNSSIDRNWTILSWKLIF